MKNFMSTRLGRWLKAKMFKHMHNMISCREFEDFVRAYTDGDLPGPQRSIFELHLRLCRECREYLAAYQQSMEVGAAVLGLADEPVPDAVPEDLIKAILEARKEG